MNEEYVFNLDKEMQTYDEAYFGRIHQILILLNKQMFVIAQHLKNSVV